MPTRQRVTQETIERAIKARLARDCDVGSPCMATRVPVEKADDDATGSNWRLDTGVIPPNLRDAYVAAAGSVARSFNLL
ncbi:MAG TPA: hypothetical protein VJM11_04805 [Nevskiaceae bacterium]|nr:hypothetical protein [Nevskiaceae bacterium]